MTAQKLDGTATLRTIKDELAARVAALPRPGRGARARHRPGRRRPGLALVRRRQAQGLRRGRDRLDPARPAGDRHPGRGRGRRRRLNDDPACTGFIVQLPLPKARRDRAALELIDPDKDADGLHPMNLGKLVLGQAGPLPCTPRGIIELLRRHDVPIAGAEVVVIGRGLTVGRPLGLLLTRRPENATVTLCHTGTVDLAAHVRAAPTSSSPPPGVPGWSAPTWSSPARPS